MDQHPVPRNITGFQFQLIGSMTVKQFGYLLVGLILAFVFFKLPLSIFRFPIAGVCVFIGFAFAFLPIQERPLDIWVVNLIKSIYSPTLFVWKKGPVLPEVLTHIPKMTQTARQQTQIAHHHDAKDKLAAYLQTIAPTEQELLDEREKKILHDVYTFFSESPKRLGEFLRFKLLCDLDPSRLLEPCQTRWLSLEACVVRFLKEYNMTIDWMYMRKG